MGINAIVHSSLNHFFHGSTGGKPQLHKKN
jgi:hypothetical protein